jgi:hypothetical protein
MRQPMTTPDAWVVLWETWCHMPPENCAQLWGCLPPWAQRRLAPRLARMAEVRAMTCWRLTAVNRVMRELRPDRLVDALEQAVAAGTLDRPLANRLEEGHDNQRNEKLRYGRSPERGP